MELELDAVALYILMFLIDCFTLRIDPFLFLRVTFICREQYLMAYEKKKTCPFVDIVSTVYGPRYLLSNLFPFLPACLLFLKSTRYPTFIVDAVFPAA